MPRSTFPDPFRLHEGRTGRWFIAAIGLAFAMTASAQSLRKPREAAPIDEAVWVQLSDTMTLGCRFRPPEAASGTVLAPAAIDRACGCMGRRFADRARASEPFRAALRSDDRSTIAQLARAFVVEPDGRRSFAACADDEASLGARLGALLGR